MDGIRPELEFLSTLFSEHWRQKPGLFQHALNDFTTDEALLESIRLAANRSNSGATFYSFAKDREVRGEEALKFIPNTNSLEDYFANLRHVLEGDNFGLMITGYEQVCPDAWTRLRVVLDYMVDHVGVPVGSVSCALLLGNYSGANFGIRRDPTAGVISLGLRGRKRMLIWPKDYFEGRDVKRMKFGPAPTAAEMILEEPDTFAADAIELEFDIGDLAYWPEGWWNLAYQKEESQVWVTLNINIQVGVALSTTIAALTAALLRDRFGEDDLFFPDKGLDTQQTPQEMQAAIDTLKALVQSGDLRRSVQDLWRQKS